MSSAKRAIMVPIMTLAVCAIAMVGLGFALTTSVTSNSNTVEKLMVDLEDKATDFDGKNQIDEDDVDKLFKFTVSTEKTMVTEEDVTKAQVKFTMNGGKAYFKVFGNVETAKLTVKYTNTSGSFSGSTPIMKLTITDMNYVGTATESTPQTTTPETQSVDVGNSTGVSITVNHVYEVQVTSFDGITFTFNNTDNAYTYTGKYDTNNQIPTITTGTFGLTFTATS